jgi:hypothetical protein
MLGLRQLKPFVCFVNLQSQEKSKFFWHSLPRFLPFAPSKKGGRKTNIFFECCPRSKGPNKVKSVFHGKKEVS